MFIVSYNKNSQEGVIHIFPLIIILLLLIGITIFVFIKSNGTKPKSKTQKQLQEKVVFSSPSPTPTPVGNLKGNIVGGYYSRDVGGVQVLIKELTNIKGTSLSDGSFEIKNIPIGNYSVSFSHPEYTFSEMNINIKEGSNILDKNVSGWLTNPKPTQVNGNCYSDKNDNKSKDGNDVALDAVLSLHIKKGGSWTHSQSIKSDPQGNFSLSLQKTGVYKIEPGGYTFYTKPGSQEFTVDGYGGTKNYSFAYKPNQSQAGFKVYVFNDKNENGSKDSDEEYIHYQSAKITNLSGTSTMAVGNTWNVVVGEDGFQISYVDYGDYKIELYPENDSWGFYYKITKKEATLTVNATSDHQTVTLGAHKLH
jgi:hypothetical protein